jgi:hypothetical protein
VYPPWLVVTPNVARRIVAGRFATTLEAAT